VAFAETIAANDILRTWHGFREASMFLDIVYCVRIIVAIRQSAGGISEQR
jgi:hypothetical protein